MGNERGSRESLYLQNCVLEKNNSKISNYKNKQDVWK